VRTSRIEGDDLYAGFLEDLMRKKINDQTRPPLKEQWPILAVGAGIVGLLAWLSWEVTRPEKAGTERR
jgi:hypothetical protein